MRAALLLCAVVTCAPVTGPPPITWRRAELLEAGISIDQNPDWATSTGDRRVLQQFPGGAVVVRWGQDATIEDALAHVGLGTGGTRTIEVDEPAVVDGMPARRVRIRFALPESESHSPGTVHPPERESLFAAVGFTTGQVPVLVSYSLPASQVASMTPLVEHVLSSVRKR